jgi:hypothetical protein
MENTPQSKSAQEQLEELLILDDKYDELIGGINDMPDTERSPEIDDLEAILNQIRSDIEAKLSGTSEDKLEALAQSYKKNLEDLAQYLPAKNNHSAA